MSEYPTFSPSHLCLESSKLPLRGSLARGEFGWPDQPTPLGLNSPVAMPPSSESTPRVIKCMLVPAGTTAVPKREDRRERTSSAEVVIRASDNHVQAKTAILQAFRDSNVPLRDFDYLRIVNRNNLEVMREQQPSARVLLALYHSSNSRSVMYISDREGAETAARDRSNVFELEESSSNSDSDLPDLDQQITYRPARPRRPSVTSRTNARPLPSTATHPSTSTVTNHYTTTTTPSNSATSSGADHPATSSDRDTTNSTGATSALESTTTAQPADPIHFQNAAVDGTIAETVPTEQMIEGFHGAHAASLLFNRHGRQGWPIPLSPTEAEATCQVQRRPLLVTIEEAPQQNTRFTSSASFAELVNGPQQPVHVHVVANSPGGRLFMTQQNLGEGSIPAIVLTSSGGSRIAITTANGDMQHNGNRLSSEDIPALLHEHLEHPNPGPTSTAARSTDPHTNTADTSAPHTNTAAPSAPNTNTAAPSAPNTNTAAPSAPHTNTAAPSAPNTNTAAPSAPNTNTAAPSAPHTNTAAPSAPHTNTAAPSAPNTNTAAPSAPNTNTAAPSAPNTNTAAPSAPNTNTAAPSAPHTNTAAPSAPNTNTAAPSAPNTNTAAPSAPNTNTAAPSAPNTNTAAPSAPNTNTAAPSAPNTNTAAPSAPNTNTAAPSAPHTNTAATPTCCPTLPTTSSPTDCPTLPTTPSPSFMLTLETFCTLADCFVPNARSGDLKIRSARLRLFGHIARAEPPLELGSLRETWTNLLSADLQAAGLDITSAWVAARDRKTWSMRS
ncbi:hypothetical protein Bbelb_143860 [Branchiostoma belcheri]|nr:hypothetical protein Bbelb_143860 [Branchiostoma belcheri]